MSTLTNETIYGNQDSMENQSSNIDNDITSSRAAMMREMQEKEMGEFAYRPVPMLVPISMFLAIVSLTSFLGLFGVIISFVALGLSVMTFLFIRRSDGAYTGTKSSGIAIFVSSFALVGGVSYLSFLYATEVPPGYTRVNFYYDIAKYNLSFHSGDLHIHKSVKGLHEKKIFTKGYMYPQREQKDIKQFIMCKDTGECCFGGKPKANDMILVKNKGENKIRYYNGSRVSVGGVFKIDPTYVEEGGLSPVYIIESDYFSVSKTQF